ncbi:hypothetical protein [Anseongella ginsenosidimutans]|uniref:hypothetical protein n=1 Tax=Anseongella ginsenosidimutans TaxID=496056 RepID=UPI001052BFD9|nr:hypothetical protein [Anseongella ginsenosidimutans]QEC53910.1 hypothetical protein FRZ59_17310 [Anseongella ginsenosidimutans]
MQQYARGEISIRSHICPETDRIVHFRTAQLLRVATGLLYTTTLMIASCSANPKEDDPASGNRLSATPPGDSADLENLLTLSNAERVLGEPGYLKDHSLTVEEDISVYKAAYAAGKDRRAGKRGILYVMVEDYSKVSSAEEVYADIKRANENHSGVKILADLGDEAYFHTDGKNFYFIIARKAGKILRLKINRITSNTSLEEFNRIAREIVASL